ncbi:alpha/beta hydrolase [Halobium salinum]|uniref:Alpha/beta hydrolase n=1 Tax=Halobium salinum TaxID=1364940 RepID=A0ABD5PBB6_9EURY|nr:alpha/beta hydrolase [Halobium salinum]
MSWDPSLFEAGENPNRDHPIETAGAPPVAAEAAVVMLHGRGSTGKQILRLADEFLRHGAMYLAPQAAGRSWYPWSAAAPREENEPWVSAALERVADAVDRARDAGVPPERTLLFGFSQGACLAAEFVARNPRRYGGVVVLSGGLLGPDPGAGYDGSLAGTPVFLGCGSDDPHVGADRAEASAGAFERLGGDVTCRCYDDLGHEINDDEVRETDALLGRLV